MEHLLSRHNFAQAMEMEAFLPREVSDLVNTNNADLAFVRQFPMNELQKNSYFQFRAAEAYNELNTPESSATTAAQGATPITQVDTLNFGQITATSVAPRLFQMGLKYIF